MDRPDRLLITGALLLLLAGSVGGAAHGYFVGHDTLLQLREQYEQAFTFAASGRTGAAATALAEARASNYRYVRVIDAHTHLTKLATLLLLLGIVNVMIVPGIRTRRWMASALITGAVLFPVSVYLQIIYQGVLFRSAAAIGALLVIMVIAWLTAVLFKSPA